MKSEKKKGYTLIETVISIAIIILLLPVIATITIESIVEFKKYNEYIVELNNLDAAVLNIDKLLREEAIEEIYKGKDSVYKTDSIFIKIIENEEKNLWMKKQIYIRGKDIKIKTTRYNGKVQISNKTNTLLNKVEEFDILEKENLIYYIIEMESGLKRIRSL